MIRSSTVCHSSSHHCSHNVFIEACVQNSFNEGTSDRQGYTYQYDDGYRTSKAPDEFVIDGDPTEVWVPITLWVQAHRQACSKETDGQMR